MSRNSSTGPSGSRRELYAWCGAKNETGCVAPVVDQPRRAILGVELEHRQQLDGGDAEVLEVRDLLDQAGVGAAVASPTPELGWRVKPRTCIS
jgi:hypothetical protein